MEEESVQCTIVGEKSGNVNSSFVDRMNRREHDSLRSGLLQWDQSRSEKRVFLVDGNIESLCDSYDILNSIIDYLSVEVNGIDVS